MIMTGHEQGNEGVKTADPRAFTGQCVILAHVAAENLHGRNAQAQGEEGLVHGGGNHVANAHLFDGLPEVGHQIEFQALRSAGQGEGVDSQHYDQDQKGASSCTC